MHVYIYKDKLGDCTNGGISSKNIEGLCITNINNSPYKPCKDYPAAKLVLQTFGHGSSVKIVPEEINEDVCMFGGNFAHTSDSRFTEAVEELLGQNFYGAVPIHDRVE